MRKDVRLYDALIEQARAGCLPDDFDQWELADPAGWSIAHAAAEAGTLPHGFDKWALATCSGWTVAHVAVIAGTGLPAGFEQWGLADRGGWTVAHQAASSGNVPAHFSAWLLQYNDGVTVVDIAQHRGLLRDGEADYIRRSLSGKKGMSM